MENQPSISSDLIRGHIDTIILHSLTEGDKFAQQISDSVESKSDNAYKINQATLYSSLKRLESLKLVSSYWNDCDGGRRKFFSITEAGIKTVKDNLSSWSYSRSIIDKLMNLSPAPATIITKIVEKPTYIYAEKPNMVENQENISSVKEVQEPPKSEEKQENINSNDKSDEEHEINFRNIINGLVEISNQSAHTTVERKTVDIEPISYDDTSEQKNEILKFNETINETDYNATKTHFDDKVDYGDLIHKAEKEGYIVRISSKNSAKPIGNILINKLNFIVSMVVFIIALIEIGLLYAVYKDNFNLPILKFICALPAVPFLLFGVIFLIKTGRLAKRKVSPDSVLTAAIVAFNLILINLAVDFILDVDFSDLSMLLAALIIPVIYYFDLIVFFFVRLKLSKKKAFSYK